ncbi:MAG: pyrroloquinoline quinone precursor peptide PqqA [Gemmatimonadota bacterium]
MPYPLYRRVPAARLGAVTQEDVSGAVRPSTHQHWRIPMSWKKPEFEVVAVTLEVTAYVATL